MNTVDIVRNLGNWNLSVPMFHRAQISLMPGSTYESVLLVPLSNNTGTNFASEMPQLVVTPFAIGDWNHLWRLSCTVKERIGVVNEILETLKKYNLNVLSEVSRPIDLNRFHQIETIFSSRYYSMRPKGYAIEKAMQRVYEELLSNHIDTLRLTSDFQADLRIDPFIPYRSLIQRYIKQSFNKGDIYHARLEARSSKNNTVFMDIPYHWQEELCRQLKVESPEDISFIIHTNSLHQLMSVYFPQPDRSLSNFRIIHQDRVGALAAFASALKQEDVNFISTLTRKQREKINHFEIVCEKKNCSPKQLRESVQRALSTHKALDFKPILAVPISGKDWANWKEIWHWKDVKKKLSFGQPVLPSDEPIFSVEDQDKANRKNLMRKRKDYNKRQRRTMTLAEEQEGTARLAIINHTLQKGLAARPTVFIASKMEDHRNILRENLKALVDKLIEAFEDEGFHVLTGVGKERTDSLKEALGRQLDKSQFFVGILTADDEMSNPSHWVIWEYGYAEAKKCTCAIFRDSKVRVPGLISQPAIHLKIPMYDMTLNQIQSQTHWEEIDEEISTLVERFSRESRRRKHETYSL